MAYRHYIWAITGFLAACSPADQAAAPNTVEAGATVLASARPQSRPDFEPRRSSEPEPVAAAAPPIPAVPSTASTALVARYASLAQRQQSRGLLRRDRTPDLPVTPALLARNFEAVAFSSEHMVSTTGAARAGANTPLARWERPVRVELVLGDSLTPARRQAVQGDVATTVAQLARATGHPITAVTSGGNFKVLVLSEDDRAALTHNDLARLVPGLPYSVQRALLRPNPDARCLVVGLSGFGNPHSFTSAVALVRAELPGVLRYACVQEELAQGLGLPNDSRGARPSIFNDDDEFAVLTQHDFWLLQMLYDPRLRPGMSVEDARPVYQQIANELAGPQVQTVAYLP